MRAPRLARVAGRPMAMALVVASFASVAAWGSLARADEKQICAHASEEAQRLRSSGRPKEAREKLLLCVRDACPSIVRKDCTQWLAEVSANLPSVVVGARDDSGKDVVNVKVTLDGEPFTDTLDGKAISVNPGVHTFHYEVEGAAPVDEQVVIREGEKNRELIVTFKRPHAAVPAAPAPAPAPGPAPEVEASRSHAPPVLTYVFGGVAVAAAGVYAGFGITGKNDVDHLRASCAPDCTTSQKNGASTDLLIANVSFGVGVATLATAAIVWAASPGSPNPPSHTARWLPFLGASTHLDLFPLQGGAAASFRGRF